MAASLKKTSAVKAEQIEKYFPTQHDGCLLAAAAAFFSCKDIQQICLSEL